MKNLFELVKAALQRGEDAVLCSIISSSGSSPRSSGAMMAVFQDGQTSETIGGGAVELESIRIARAFSSCIHEFKLTPNAEEDIGMICGGDVTVCFYRLCAGDDRLIAVMDAAIDSRQRHTDAWLVTRISDGIPDEIDVFESGSGLICGSDIKESDIEGLCSTHAKLSYDEPRFFVNPISRSETVYVFGGGHVAQELVPLIVHVGFHAVVLEDRPEFARRELFPDADDVMLCNFNDIAASVRIKASDYAVVMTHGHQSDFEIQCQVLRLETFYIGVIGSRHKIAATRERLLAAGIPEARISDVHTPIGLDIGAETPAEIAISIASELIAVRAGKDSR